ncbi:MAG: hypothetical protein QM784_35900 [Polyangiaceae bacterium]
MGREEKNGVSGGWFAAIPATMGHSLSFAGSKPVSRPWALGTGTD